MKNQQISSNSKILYLVNLSISKFLHFISSFILLYPISICSQIFNPREWGNTPSKVIFSMQTFWHLENFHVSSKSSTTFSTLSHFFGLFPVEENTSENVTFLHDKKSYDHSAVSHFFCVRRTSRGSLGMEKVEFSSFTFNT